MVDCTGLENRQRATVREFESHRFRQFSIMCAINGSAAIGAVPAPRGDFLRKDPTVRYGVGNFALKKATTAALNSRWNAARSKPAGSWQISGA